ncbi:MAG: hypothetical protein FWC72_08320 [Oscillospiraceae bacterium]|nr:hypothetical protein [Oscillospiraceae bacterium]
MKLKVLPIALIAILVLLHIFASPFRPISLAQLIHAVVYLCAWAFFLYYCAKIKSKGLLRFYLAFWSLAVILFLAAVFAFGIGFRRTLSPVTEFVLYLVFRGYEIVHAPLIGLEIRLISGAWLSILVPVLMVLAGFIVRRKCVR